MTSKNSARPGRIVVRFVATLRVATDDMAMRLGELGLPGIAIR